MTSRPQVSRIEFRSFQFSVEFPIKEVKFLVNPEMVSIRVQDRGTSTLFCPATQVGGSTGDGPKKCVANRDSPVRDNMAFLG